MNNLQSNLVLGLGLIVCWGILLRIHQRQHSLRMRPVRIAKNRTARGTRDSFN